MQEEIDDLTKENAELRERDKQYEDEIRDLNREH